MLDDPGLLGNAGNRIQHAEAVALYIQDRIAFGRWAVSPGLRYESIDQERTRFETRYGRTGDPASRDPSNLRDTRQNRTRVWLPGMGVSFDPNERLRLFGGVHKGFTAPTNAPGVNEEAGAKLRTGAARQRRRLARGADRFLERLRQPAGCLHRIVRRGLRGWAMPSTAMPRPFVAWRR